MGRAYREATGDLGQSTTFAEMRKLCQRPGRSNQDGIIYFTQQHHKKECDVNHIITKYDKTGLLVHVQKMEASFGDVTGLDFKAAQDLVIGSEAMFNDLPSDIRKRFGNSAFNFLSFMEDPNNRDEAISLGLIAPDSDQASDGLGEHVVDGEVKTKPVESKPVE